MNQLHFQNGTWNIAGPYKKGENKICYFQLGQNGTLFHFAPYLYGPFCPNAIFFNKSLRRKSLKHSGMQTDESNVDNFMINIYKYLIRIDTKITKFQPYEHPLTLDHEAVIFWMGPYSDVPRCKRMKIQCWSQFGIFSSSKNLHRGRPFLTYANFKVPFCPPGPLCPTFPYNESSSFSNN